MLEVEKMSLTISFLFQWVVGWGINSIVSVDFISGQAKAQCSTFNVQQPRFSIVFRFGILCQMRHAISRLIEIGCGVDRVFEAVLHFDCIQDTQINYRRATIVPAAH